MHQYRMLHFGVESASLFIALTDVNHAKILKSGRARVGHTGDLLRTTG